MKVRVKTIVSVRRAIPFVGMPKCASQIADERRLSVFTVRKALRILREVGEVRLIGDGKTKYYFRSNPKAIEAFKAGG